MSPLSPVGEVTKLREQQTNVIPVTFLKSPFCGAVQLKLVKLCQHELSPCSGKQHLCRDVTCPCFQSVHFLCAPEF